MVDGDWVKLHRRLLDSRAWSDAAACRVWLWLLLSANWKTGWFMGFEVPAGSVAFGRDEAAAKLKMHPSSVYRSMKKLESWGQISIKSNNRFSIVSICNWSTYQNGNSEPEQQANNKRTTSEQQANTIEERKKERKKEEERKRETSRFLPPDPEEVSEYGRSIGFAIDGHRFCDFYEQSGWKTSSGNKIKNWKAAVRTWRSREEDKKPKPFKQRLMTPEEELEWRP